MTDIRRKTETRVRNKGRELKITIDIVLEQKRREQEGQELTVRGGCEIRGVNSQDWMLQSKDV